MAIILSIDPGCRNTGYAVFKDKDLIFSEALITESEDFYTPYYLKEHFSKLDELLSMFSPDLVAIEGPSIGSQNLQFAIGAMHGVYTLTCLNLGIPCLIIPPSKWKKLIVGKGNATKQEIKSIIKPEFFPDTRVKQDIFDAIAINLFAQKVISFLEKKATPSKLEAELILSSKGVLGSKNLNFNLQNYGKGTIKGA